MEQRIAELELRFTEQQELVQQLSEVIYAQQKTVDLLTAELRTLRKKLEGEPGVVDAKDNERPPHY
jgi:SlyX protein